MPSIRYYNQTAPFWDFVASLEDQGANHPFFARNQDNTEGQDNQEGEAGDPPTSAPEDPWSSWQGWPGWQRPRGRRGHHQPPTGDGEHPSPPAAEGDNSENPPPPPDAGEGPSNGPPPHPHHPFGPGPHRRGPHPHFRGCGPRGRGGHCGRGRGGFGGWWAPYINPAGINPMMGRGLGEFLSQMFNPEQAGSREAQGASQDFEPEADVFDTESSFVVHVSLPGAKKEDVGVNWDPEKSELSVAGVVYRPGDEEFLKTLALDERKVGAFEKKVRLGSRANPAQVDVERITAHLEDGVLRVEVPKLDKDWQEIKKVDIE